MSTHKGSRYSIALALLAPATWAAAQGQVFVVDAASGPGSDFATIQPAVDAAADGDAILVRGGVYPAFSIAAKALSVTADQGAGVTVQGGIAIHDLATGQDVAVRGIDALGPPLGHALVVSSNQGAVWVESGSFTSLVGDLSSATHGAVVEDSASVVLLRCSFLGGAGQTLFNPSDGGSGLRMARSSVAAYECQFQGGRGGDSEQGEDWFGGHGGHGVRQSDGFLYLSASACAGADGGAGGGEYDGFLGVIDCKPGGDGGSGLYLDFASTPGEGPVAYLQGGELQGGAGGPAHDDGDVVCDPVLYHGDPGQPVLVLSGSATQLASTPTSLVATSPVRELGTAMLRFHGEPGDLAFALVSAAPDFAYLAVFQGVLAAAWPGVVIGAGAVPAGGTLLAPVTAPLLAPGLESAQLFAQGAFFRPATAQILLGAPSALWILDQAL